MPATRKLLLVPIALYVLIPLPWILWRPDGLFYTFHLERLPVIAGAFLVFVLGWIAGEHLHPRGGWFQANAPEGRVERWPVATIAIVGTLLCSVIANGLLYSMGALIIDEATGRERIPLLTTLGSAHIFALIYSGCLIVRPTAARKPPLLVFLAVLSVLQTVAVGLAENRRTAVVLPVVVYVTLALVTGRTRLLRKMLWVVPVFLALFALTTFTRLDSSDAEVVGGVAEIAGDAVVGRLGNPLLIIDPILEHIASESKPFDPHTLQSIAAGLPTFGLVPPPFETGYGNAFGQALGFLPFENEFIGINSGWVGELLLLGGVVALVFGGIALGSIAASCWQLIAASNPAGIFLRVMVVIFVIGGFQMEVPFPIVSIVRATMIALVLAMAERTVANARAPR